jgi:micrococcal nuclease
MLIDYSPIPKSFRIAYTNCLLLFLLLSFSANAQFLPVTKVVDGDTFWVKRSNGKEEKIRLIGVDAPESRKTGNKDVGYYGKEAKAYLEKLLLGKSVRLEYDVSRTDRYKRTLAYAYLQNGTFLNEHLIREGYAMTLTVPPNVKYAERFAKLQAEARQKKKGLWGR